MNTDVTQQDRSAAAMTSQVPYEIEDSVRSGSGRSRAPAQDLRHPVAPEDRC